MVVPVRRKQIPDISPRPPLRHKKRINDNTSLSDNTISFSKLPSIKRKAEEKLRLIELEKEKLLQDKRRRRSKGLDNEANEFKFPSPTKQRTHIVDRLSTDEDEACFSSPPLSSNDEQSSDRRKLAVITESRVCGANNENYIVCEARKPLSARNRDLNDQTSKSNKKQTPNCMTTVGSIDYSAILQRHKMSTRTGDFMESDERMPMTDDDSNSNGKSKPRINSYVTTSEGVGSSVIGSTTSQISLPVSQNKKNNEHVDMNGSKTIAANPNK
uniref:Uncharacterized protein n=1 Tax=Romanomermis culicivorax TaxID=13658 RepID=A0A915JVH4_ROMCU